MYLYEIGICTNVYTLYVYCYNTIFMCKRYTMYMYMYMYMLAAYQPYINNKHAKVFASYWIKSQLQGFKYFNPCRSTIFHCGRDAI